MPTPSITPLPQAPSRSDPPAVFVTLADAWAASLAGWTVEVNDVTVWIGARVTEIDEAVTEGIAAIDAKLALGGFTGTSATSVAIGTGSKTLTVQPNLAFVPGARIIAAVTSDPAASFMFGTVTAYNATTGVLTFTVGSGDALGSGSHNNWTVTISGLRGSSALIRASGSDLRALANEANFVAPKSVAEAMTLTALTDAATIAVNMDLGPNFVVTLGGNRTLGAPTNAKPGSSGVILVKQDVTGGRTLNYASAWKPYGPTPDASIEAGSVSQISYFVESSGSIRFAMMTDGAA